MQQSGRGLGSLRSLAELSKWPDYKVVSDDTHPPPVEIRTTRANDIALGLCGMLLAPLWLWGVAGGIWHLTRDDMHGRGAWLAPPFYDVFDWRGVVAATAVLAFWVMCLGVGAAWRMYDPRSTVSADDDGIRFHPSIGPSLVPWSEVQSIRWVGNAVPPEIEVRLRHRFWSLWNWITSPKVRLNHIAIGLSQHQASERVKAMKNLCDARRRPASRRARKKAAA